MLAIEDGMTDETAATTCFKRSARLESLWGDDDDEIPMDEKRDRYRCKSRWIGIGRKT